MICKKNEQYIFVKALDFCKSWINVCESYLKWNKQVLKSYSSYSSNILLANRSKHTQDVWLTCVFSRALVATLQLWWQRSSTLWRRDLEQLQTHDDKAHVNQFKLQLRSIYLATSKYFNLNFRDLNVSFEKFSPQILIASDKKLQETTQKYNLYEWSRGRYVNPTRNNLIECITSRRNNTSPLSLSGHDTSNIILRSRYLACTDLKCLFCSSFCHL